MSSLYRRIFLLALAPLAWAAAVPSSDIGLIERDTACTNGPFTRACWKNGYRYDKRFCCDIDCMLIFRH